MDDAGREQVGFLSDGLRLDAFLYLPPGGERAPAFVFCPGSRVTKMTPYYHQYIPRFVAAGFAVLLIDYRGWGESEGTVGDLYPMQQVEDIRNALTYLETRPEVDPTRLGLFGVSMGGALAVQAAGIDDRIAATIAVLAPMEGRAMLRGSRREYEWIELRNELREDRRRRVTSGVGRSIDGFAPPSPERAKTTALASDPIPPLPLACVQAIDDFRPLDVVSRIAPRAALWFAATGDPTCPVEHSRAAYALAGRPKRLIEIESDEHYGTYTKFADLIIAESVAWLARYLAPHPYRTVEDVSVTA